MSIKSAQTLVAEALTEIKTLSPAEALEMVNSDKCNLIDIRDIRELEKMSDRDLSDIGFSRSEIKARALKSIYKINI